MKIIAMIIVLILIIGGVFLFKNKKMEIEQVGNLKLSSSAFLEKENIPEKFSCDGDNVNPPLNISGIPEGAKSLALIVEDPDAPMGTWIHWIMWNIPPTETIGENTVPTGAVTGVNDFKKNSYGGPCPPSGTHTYVFKMYALDAELDLPSSSKKQDLEKAMEGHILSQTQLTGIYSR